MQVAIFTFERSLKILGVRWRLYLFSVQRLRGKVTVAEDCDFAICTASSKLRVFNDVGDI